MVGAVLRSLLKEEFSGYSLSALRADFMAGLTVGAVALPLALAFGVASGSTAAAGLVTAILGGFLIGALSGAPYQISGPTGAMSAILIILATRFGFEGVWFAGALAGVMLLAMGLFNVGRFLSFIPSSVIVGFTSGIAVIIFIGQLDNFLGVTTPPADSPARKLVWYISSGVFPDWHAIALAWIVMFSMVVMPKKLQKLIPGSLVGIIAATSVDYLTGWNVKTIGEIPTTLLLSERLSFGSIPWASFDQFILPAMTIAALGGIESLLCGEVGSRMSGRRLHANQELIAQGIGNAVIPFFGGVPATAAIARTSVGIKSGGHTRMVTFIHAAFLLLAMFFFAPILSRIPLAALSGVLIVTAWHMNEWDAIRYIVNHRFKSASIAFGATLIATVTLDLNQAIIIGTAISAIVFISQIADVRVTVNAVDKTRLREKGLSCSGRCSHVKVIYVTGPIFFAATGHLREAFAGVPDAQYVILSIRGVSLIDVAGMQLLEEIQIELEKRGGTLLFAGVNDSVRRMMDRAGLTDRIGKDKIFWGADQAIVYTDRLGA